MFHIIPYGKSELPRVLLPFVRVDERAGDNIVHFAPDDVKYRNMHPIIFKKNNELSKHTR